MKQHDLISLETLSLADITAYCDLATRVESLPEREKSMLAMGKILMTLFYEPSTRTRLSFESAIAKLGGRSIGFADHQVSSASKGESLADTIKVVENYADIIVIRHFLEGAAKCAANAARIPVINAGDGTNQHPSQTLLDLFTIRRDFGTLSGLTIALVGDLKYSRTIRSLMQSLLGFGGNRFYLVSPENLRLPSYVREQLSINGQSVEETNELREVLPYCDVIYMTRVQKERFGDLIEYEKVKDSYCLEARMLGAAKKGLRVMHPLPRVNEISMDVDSTPYAAYFEQVRNGVTMRQAILLHLLGIAL